MPHAIPAGASVSSLWSPSCQGYVKRIKRQASRAHAAIAAELAAGGAFSASSSLHARLRAQLEAIGLGRTSSPAAALHALLPIISRQYEQLDEERRGVVRSMQMLAEEARNFSSGLVSADAAQLRAILDHIKDVVITITSEGAISVFNPTGEQLFGYSQSELIGVSIVRLLPDLALQGSLSRGLQSFAAQFNAGGGTSEARVTAARRKDGVTFPVQLVASPVQIDGREMYVICLRDISERLSTEQALRDSETLSHADRVGPGSHRSHRCSHRPLHRRQ